MRGGRAARALARATATALAFVVALGLAAPAMPASATPLPAALTAVGTENTPGSQWLASCLSAGRTLSVLFVLDVSGSLLDTDRDGTRYTGLKTALTTLANTTRPDGNEVTIEAGVAGFGNRFYSTGEIVPWQRINIDSPDSLIDTMVGQARDRTAWIEDGTGFQFVVQSSIDELLSRGGSHSCKAVVWFTDGDPSDPEAVVDMCRPGGVVDTMRANGIVLIGLRLSQNGQPEPTPDMRAMTLGQGGGMTCGTVPIPESSAPGIYLEATDVKRLFASIRNITEGCTPTGDVGHYVDPGIRRVRVNIATTGQTDSVRFDLPDGISFTAGTQGSSTPSGSEGIAVTSIRDDYYVSMELELPPGVGVGEWLVSAPGAPSPDDIEFCVFSDLHLALDPDSVATLKAGGTGILVVEVLDGDDEPADLSLFDTAAAGVSLIGPDGNPRTAEANVDPDGHTIELVVRTETSDARLDLEVSLALTTQSGLALTPLGLATPVVTLLNEFYPKVTPLDELDLGEALREDPVTAEITVVGSEKGPSQVCFDAPDAVLVPQGAANADPTYPIGCLDLAPGETRTLSVTAATTTAVEGDGSALIPVTIVAAPDETGYVGEAHVNLPVIWRFSNPLNVGLLIWALAAVILAAVLLPLLALYWATWVTARFDVTNLRITRIPLTIDESGIARVHPIPGQDAIVGGMERHYAKGARTSILLWGRQLARSFTIDRISFRSRTSPSPFRPARFWVESVPGTTVLSSFGSQTGRDALPQSAPFAPAFTVAAVWSTPSASITPTGPVEGMLLVLQTTQSRRAPRVDPNEVVRSVPWSTMLAQYRADATGPDLSTPGGSSPLPPPPPGSTGARGGSALPPPPG